MANNANKGIDDAAQAMKDLLATNAKDADKPLTPEEKRRKRKRVKRRANPRAAFHMSKNSVGMSSDDLGKLTNLEAVHWLADSRWGSKTEMPCPHCGTVEVQVLRKTVFSHFRHGVLRP